MLQLMEQYFWLPLYALALEGFFLIILQMRNICLIKKQIKAAVPKREKLETWKAQIKNGQSDIPAAGTEKIVRSEKKDRPVKEERTEKAKQQTDHGYDPREMQILQDMMAEFFGS
ncbi:MAG: hypothetical protein ACI4DV_06425 [Lachnospiraceae bacterium]